MNSFFEGKLSYEKLMDNGLNKKVNETYLIEAISVTEAESRLIEEMNPFITGEFQVKAVKQSKYNEIFFSTEESADRYFKCKLAFLTLDEKSGAEKKITTEILVEAADLRDAIKKLDEGMKGTMADYLIISVSETQIIDVYTYNSGE